MIDVFFQFLACPEEGQTFGNDRNAFPGFGVAPGVSIVFLDLETAETANFNAISGDESVLHGIDEGIDHHGGVLHRQMGFFSQCLDKLALVHHAS